MSREGDESSPRREKKRWRAERKREGRWRERMDVRAMPGSMDLRGREEMWRGNEEKEREGNRSSFADARAPPLVHSNVA